MLNASFTVQLVLLLLLALSVLSWAILIERWLFYRNARQTLAAFENDFWSGIDLSELYRQGNDDPGAESIFRAGFNELRRLRSKTGGGDNDALITGVQRAMGVALLREEERLETSLNFLATVGSTSPYIGLFGTVWGIMNAFRGLANLHHASLAVVAPGISEALIATAMGLFAAIPAVVAYNRFTGRANVLYNQYQTFADQFSSLLHRWVHAGKTQ